MGHTKNFYLAVIATLLVGLGVIFAAARSLAAPAYFDPHGNYEVSTEGCAMCHVTHAADGRVLFAAADEKQLCYKCHDGSYSNYNVKKEFGETVVGVSVYASYHPIPQGTQSCTTCHNPHLTNSTTPMLLNVGTSKTSSGNAVCGECHGPNTGIVGGDVYSPFVGTPHDVKMNALASGTQIKCIRCHQPHGSSIKPLLQNEIVSQTGGVYDVTGNNNSLCFGCHQNALGGFGGQTVYNATYHGTKTESTVATVTYQGESYTANMCLNCHEPHGKTQVSYYRRAFGNALCTNCHDDSSVVLPAAYSYQGIDLYKNSKHGSVVPSDPKIDTGDCLNCHTAHGQDDGTGQPIPKQLKAAADQVCFGGGVGCHSDSKNSLWGVNVAKRFTAGIDPSSRHSVNPSEQQAQGTFVKCTTCHEPHLDTASQRVVEPGTNTPFTLDNGLSKYIGPGGEIYMMLKAKHDSRPPQMVGDITLISMTATSAKVTWQTDESSQGWLEWGTTTSYIGGIAAATVSTDPVTNITTNTVSFGGLTDGTNYHFRAKNVDLMGNYAYSGDYTFQPPTLAAPEPSYYMAGSTAVIKWTTDQPTTTQIVYSPDSVYSQVQSYVYTYDDPTTKVSSHSVTLTGLDPNETYHFQLRGTSYRGLSFSSGDYFVHNSQPPSVPVPIAHGNVSDPSRYDYTLTLQWNPSTDPEGDTPLYYQVQIGVDPTFATGTTTSAWLSDTNWTTSISNSYTWTYYWRVRAKDRWEAASNWSDASSFTHEGFASCPNLYVFNGTGYQFITDLAGADVGKFSTITGKYVPIYPGLPIGIPWNALQPKDGKYSLRIKSERDEVDYADNLMLMAVDHPVGTRIALNDLVRGKQPSRYYTYSENLLPVKQAIFQDNNSYSGGKPIPPTDVTRLIAKADNQEAWGTYGDDNQFTLDLGKLDVHQPVKLVMQGWTEFQSRGEMTANSGKVKKGIKRAPSFYEVQQPDGTWKRWPMEHFNGYTKTVVLDLTGKFPRDTAKFVVRLRGMLRPRIDFIGVDVTPGQKTVEQYPKLLSADLHYRGVSKQDYKTFDYDKLVKDVILHQGNFTKYGDVLPLLQAIDDKLVIMDSGDELSLEYQELPPPAPGMTRSFILKPMVYYKEFELAKVDPIPFRNMDMYQLPGSLGPYPKELQEYVREWNTREHQAGKRVPTFLEEVREALSSWVEKVAAFISGLFEEKQTATTKPPALEYQTTYPLWVADAKPENHYSLNTNYVLLQLDNTVTTSTYNINSPGTGMWTGTTEPTPDTPGTDASANKSKIAADDLLKWTTDNYPALNTPAEDGLYNYQMLKFVVDSQSDKYYSMKILWKGYGEKSKGYDTTLSLWNFQTGQWDVAESRVVGTETAVPVEKYVDLPNYCLKCHGGTLPSGVNLGTNTHNVALSYPGDIHGGAAGQGWINASGTGEFTALQTTAGTIYAPYARNSAALPCTDCHDTHGSQNAYHLRENLNVTTAVYVPTPNYADNAKMATFCGGCHAGTVAEYHAACLGCHRRIPVAAHYEFYNNTPQDDDFGRACISCHKHGWSMPSHGQCHCFLNSPAKAF